MCKISRCRLTRPDSVVSILRVTSLNSLESDSAPSRRLQIIFDNYVNDESSGTIETVNSYNGLDYSKEIPLIGGTRASDYIDYRPRVSAYSTSSTISPFAFLSRTFTKSSSETLVSNKSIKLDYNYYLGRIDRLYPTKNGTFELKKGEPSEFPKAPLPNDEAFEVAIISMSPYTEIGRAHV